MNEKNILFGKMFLIFALLLSMPFAYAAYRGTSGYAIYDNSGVFMQFYR